MQVKLSWTAHLHVRLQEKQRKESAQKSRKKMVTTMQIKTQKVDGDFDRRRCVAQRMYNQKYRAFKIMTLIIAINVAAFELCCVSV